MHVRTENISKEFNDRNVLTNVSLEARAGYILGVLGPPGSGKTTLLRILLNIINPDAGSVTYDDEQISARIRNAMGYLPQSRGLYPDYSVNKVLNYFARLKKLSRKKARVESVRLLDRFNMIEQMDTPVAELPADFLQKLMLMTPIIHNPDLLILDEPFSGFDAGNQLLIHKIVQRFRDEGKTIILATENMNDAEKFCDEIVMLNHGRIVLQDSVENIRSRFRENLVLIDSPNGVQQLKSIKGIKRILRKPQEVRLYIDDSVGLRQTMNEIINTVKLNKIEVGKAGLHDVYLDLTKNKKSSDE